MGNTTIPAELVAINAIQGTLIADNAITAVHIGQNQVHSVQLAINSVTATQIADGTITSAKIQDGAIATADIADVQITTAKLADNSVTSAKIVNASIVSADIANNAILTQHIDDNQITADQIADNAVGLGQMAGLTRGSIIYGDSAGDPAYLAAGTSGHVLTSDGTDISWTADTDLFLATTGGTITGDLTISEATATLKFTDTDNNYDATIAGLSGSLVLTADSGAEIGSETIQFHTGGSSTLTLDASQNSTFAGTVIAANLLIDTDVIVTDSTNDRVGINKTSPATTLDVGGSIYFSSILRGTSDGSASSPTIQPGNDGDTGLYRPAANQIGFTTAGTNALTINGSQNSTFAGNIKTTGYLEVASSQPRILLDRGDGSYSWNIYNGDGTGNFALSTFNIANNGGTAVLTLLDNGNATFAGKITSTELTITGGSDGADVYINNTSPTLAFTDSNSYSDSSDMYIIRGGGTGDLQFQFFDNSANTTTTTFTIDEVGDAAFTGSVNILDGSTDFTISGDSSDNTYFVSNGEFRIRPAGTTINKFVIGSNGNLTTAGTISSGALTVTSTSSTQFINATDTDMRHKFESNASGDHILMRLIGSDGVDNKFIIGYGPNHVSTPNMIALKATHASGSIGFYTGASSANVLTLDSSQNANFANNITLGNDKYILMGNDSGDAFNAESKIRIQDSTNAWIQIKAGTGHSAGLLVGDTDDDFVGGFIYNNSTNELTISANNAPRLTISDGGIELASGNIQQQNGNEIRSKDTGGNVRTIMRINTSNELEYGWSANGAVKFMGGGSYTEKMRIHTTGDIGVGTDNPAVRLHAYHPTTNVVGRFESGDNQVWIDLHDNNSGSYGALLGHDSTFDFMVANAAVYQMLQIRKASTMIEIGNGYGIVADNGRSANVSVSTSFTTVLNMNSLGSGDSRGFYLVTVCRSGGSVGTNYIALIGASSSSNSYIYEVLTQNSLAGQMSGSNLQIRLTSGSGTAPLHTTCIPIGIHANDS